MGLRERRAVKNYEENIFPEQKARIDAAYGSAIEVDVDWDAIAVDGMDHMYDEAFTKVYFDTIAGVFERIAIDDFGREALQAGVTKVAITNSDSFSNHRGFSFEEGVFTLDHKPTYNIDSVTDRVDNGAKLLEDAL